ncbi:MAG: MFS transporter [Desulfobacterales bacterium]|nr:MFS transporter [Desulfobacterales bacterium]
MNQKDTGINWLNVILLSLGAGVVYLIPYMRGSYYAPMMEALNITNTQMGVIQGFFGLLTLVCYFPGGWLADRFPANQMLAVSMVGLGVGGFYFATFPSYPMVVALHVWFGIACTLTFWASFVRAQRASAPPDSQSKVFGFVECGRRVVSIVVAMVGSWLLARATNDVEGFRSALLLYSGAATLSGVLIFFMLKEDSRFVSSEKKTVKEIADGIRLAVKIPAVWIIGLMIMTIYSSYHTQYVTTPYLTSLGGLTAGVAAAIASIRNYGIGPIGAFFGGILGDRYAPSTVMMWGAAGVAIVSVIFSFIGASPSILWLLLLVLFIFMTAHFGVRAVFYAMLEEGKVPIHVTGAATGIIATLAYAGDFYCPIYQGMILDKFPGQTGYSIIFGISAAWAVATVVLAIVFKRTTAAKALDAAAKEGRTAE